MLQLKCAGWFLSFRPEQVLPVAEETSKSSELNSNGWRLLCEGEPLKAIEEFSKAIDLDRGCAVAYNNRGIAKEISGQNEAAQQDYVKADSLAGEGKCGKSGKRSLELNRKWKPIGWQARGEPEAKCKAEEADFLLSFANPDSAKNNQILALLQQGVWFGDRWGCWATPVHIPVHTPFCISCAFSEFLNTFPHGCRAPRPSQLLPRQIHRYGGPCSGWRGAGQTGSAVRGP